MKNLFKYSAVPTDDAGDVEAGTSSISSAQPDAKSSYFEFQKTSEEGLSYKSIFTYSSPGNVHHQGSGFTEYWRPEYSVVNELRNEDEDGIFDSLIWLFLNPPFATSDKPKQSPFTTDTESIVGTAMKIGRHAAWGFTFLMFSLAWLVFFPFHWYWTLSRVRLNEAIVVFRVGQPPIVRKKAGTFICLWPVLDRLHRVALSRRGFSVPPTQIALNDGSVVRLGADVSFHVVDPLRFVRMATDTATSIRHVVHGQFMGYLGRQSIEDLQRFSGGVQTELRSLCSRHLAQFGIVVDTFVLSQLEVIKQPTDAGQDLIRQVLQAMGGSGSASPLSSISSIFSSAAMHCAPSGIAGASSSASDSHSDVEEPNKNEMLKMSEFLSEALRQIPPETRSSVSLSPDAMFRLTIGDNTSWLIYPYSGHVDGPLKMSGNENSGANFGCKEKGSVRIADWKTLEELRSGSLSPIAASMSGVLTVSGDAMALASLFDTSKL